MTDPTTRLVCAGATLMALGSAATFLALATLLRRYDPSVELRALLGVVAFVAVIVPMLGALGQGFRR